MVYTNLENPLADDESLCPSLSYKQRIIGFIVCLGIGIVMEVIAFVTLFNQQYVEFGVINTIANCFALGSTFFLTGPKKQLKKMFEQTRIIATIVYLITLVGTFVVALWLKIAWLTILMVIVQYIAMIWYSISYIPFARDAVKKCITAPCSS
jgi:hypothetical protein